MNRKAILLHTAYGHTNLLARTPIEHRMGRLMRASAPPGDFGGFRMDPAPAGGGQSGQSSGGESQSGGNNQGGNSGGTGSESQSGNNSGAAFDYSSFWNEPASESSGSPASQGSEGSGGSGGGTGTGDGNADFGKTLGQQLDSMGFGGDLMTPDIATKIAEGDFKDFNTAVTSQLRAAAKQSLQMNLQVLQRFGDQMMAEMDKRMTTTSDSRDHTRALHEAVPLARDPKSAPIVNSIFAQSMKLNKGNVDKAIEMTKGMLANMHGALESDPSLGIAPRNPIGDSGMGSNRTNWIDELTSR